MREEMVGACHRRNAFLLRNKSLLMPFMPDPASGSAFFDKIEEEIRMDSAKTAFTPPLAVDGGSEVDGVCLELDYRALPVNEHFAMTVSLNHWPLVYE